MAQAETQGTAQGSAETRGSERQKEPSTQTGSLESSQGRTTVADSVVTKIAAIATREVSGIHELGGGAARAFGAIRERIPGSGGSSTSSQGVTVEVGEKQAAIDLVVVVEYGVPIAEVAKGVRRNVIKSVENMAGLEIVEVNINVVDVYIPGEESETPQPSRVE